MTAQLQQTTMNDFWFDEYSVKGPLLTAQPTYQAGTLAIKQTDQVVTSSSSSFSGMSVKMQFTTELSLEDDQTSPKNLEKFAQQTAQFLQENSHKFNDELRESPKQVSGRTHLSMLNVL